MIPAKICSIRSIRKVRVLFCPLPYGAIPINGIAQMSPVKLKGWHGKPPVSTSTRPRHSVKSVVVMSS